MSEKPNSQERRKSSNIEVRIPQVFSSNEESDTPAAQLEPEIRISQATTSDGKSDDIVAKIRTEIEIPKESASNNEAKGNVDPVPTQSKDEEKSLENDTNIHQESNNFDARQKLEDNDSHPLTHTTEVKQKTENAESQQEDESAQVQQDKHESQQENKILPENIILDSEHKEQEDADNTQENANNEKGVDSAKETQETDTKVNEEKPPKTRDEQPHDFEQDQPSSKDHEVDQQELMSEKEENIKQIDTETNIEANRLNTDGNKISENEDKKDFDTTVEVDSDENLLKSDTAITDDMKMKDGVKYEHISKPDTAQKEVTKEAESTKEHAQSTNKTNHSEIESEIPQVQQGNKTKPAEYLKEEKKKLKIEAMPTTKTEPRFDKNSAAARDGESKKKETRKPSTPRSPKLRSLEAMQAALSTRKKSESGFVLSSQFEELEEESLPSRELPEGDESDAEPKHKLTTTSVHFQSGQSNKDTEMAYLTETPDRVFTPDGREARGSHTYSPAYFDTGARRSPEGGAKDRKPKQKEKRDPKKAKLLERLNLPKPPEKFVLKLRPLKKDPDSTNKAPLNPNIYYAEVPKEGGVVKTPFYMQVDIPNGALDGNVRLKFEKQEFDRMKLGLSESDTLCSYIVDLTMEPNSYCLRQSATVRMRILDKCINKSEDTMIITARHFSWTRIPTAIESKNVNGEKHYYAVMQSQSFGKFAVINAKKMDRFLISTAGGLFTSTIIPEIRLHVDENHLSQLPTQMIEMIVKETKQDAVERINKDILAIKGVEGRLVAASAEIEISKNLMTQTGKMKHGIRFPDKLTLVLPLPPLLPTKNTEETPQTRSVIIMQKHTNADYDTINGYRYSSTAYSKNSAHRWKNVTETSRLAIDGVSFEQGETIPIKISAPGKYMVLVFEDDNTTTQEQNDPDFDLDDITNAVIESNHDYEVNIMIHQKVSQPSIIMIHVVTSDAIPPIHDTMRATNTWKQLYVSRQLLMHEWQPIKLEFKGDLQLTINQMTPQIRFFSKRWQGYQFQLEATDEAFATDLEKFVGNISFVEQVDETIQTTMSVDEGNETLCAVDVQIERAHAKPFKPTVIRKVIPKATIYREYKMKWLKDLSEEEIERYRMAHGV